ncbi:uncharacterized protein BX664DRAFT_318150 [Halteromyces radiatus]|uniref:uncharacterized protein n=1 Tax=Halteromyces radiatus TaxID=101107 RepID=UPI0022207A99|nr:uncharacterized protein BX664DRAFT_318150 [Halteromyces radiatus]KAI8078808.1 hypothetical protein BX664DRAFT_318150 [Halteromyces radiatus]
MSLSLSLSRMHVALSLSLACTHLTTGYQIIMHLKTFLLLSVFFTVLFYECLFVEAKYDEDCLARVGRSSATQIDTCKDDACRDKWYKVFLLLTKHCARFEYKLCYLRQEGGFSQNCMSQVGTEFYNLQDCESNPGDSEGYVRKQCIPYNDDCHKVICG